MDWTVSLKDSSKSSTSIPVNVTLFGNGVSANAVKLRILNDIILNLRWVLNSIAKCPFTRKKEKEREGKGTRWLSGKESTWNIGDEGDVSSIPGLRRSPEGGNGNPLHYSCLENPMDRGAWWTTVNGTTESDTTEHMHTQTHTERHTYTSTDTDAGKAVWRQRQRLEWCSHKPRDAWSHLKLDRTKEEPSLEP